MSVNRSTIAAIRFGYGFRPSETPPSGAGDLLAQLEPGTKANVRYARDPLEERAAGILEAQRLKREGKKKKDGQLRTRSKQMNKARQLRHRSDVHDRITQMAMSPYGFFERLTAFWADHFSVTAKNAPTMELVGYFEREAIRPHVAGRFADMLKASSTHPAMIIYLDQHNSIGPASNLGKARDRGLNENLAREILELHTLGVDGPYTQRDVREFAELLTGYSVDRKTLRFIFMPRRAEPGAETVLGEAYGGRKPTPDDALEFLDNLARHPATAYYIAWKLAAHFTADRPDTSLVNHISAAYQRSDGHLPTVYEALLDHPASWDTFGQKVKQPIELVVSGLRAGGVPAKGMKMHRPPRPNPLTMGALESMNQVPWKANGPDGWPDTQEAWINPQGLAARMKWAAHMGRKLERTIDPRQFLQTALADYAGDTTRFVVAAAAEKWEGIALALSSSEFNRR